MAEPDPLRIRYREVLILAVQEIIQRGQAPFVKNIENAIPDNVPGNDRDAIIKIVRNTLQNLHEGSVARYRLKLSQFQLWKPVRDRYIQETSEHNP